MKTRGAFPFATSADYNSLFSRRNTLLLATTAGITSFSILCWHIRKYRHEIIEELPLAATVIPEKQRKELTQLALRTALMGQHDKSVKGELDGIRKWHVEHGFKGGLVLRELDKPLFYWEDEHDQNEAATNGYEQREVDNNNTDSNNVNNIQSTSSPTTAATLEELVLDPMRLARRECYYLYYELRGNGHLHQEIFCRGTTLWIDVLTCLQTWMVYDKELECNVHYGFLSHANRLLQDLEPLLAKDQRATISISGHSLGGAVAYIVAIKLRKRGFNVVRATAFGSPRFCGSHGLDTVNALLPQDHLRVEDDNDFVAYLPPFGRHVGSKLWFSQHHQARYVSWTENHWWTDSFWFNFRPWEIGKSGSRAHRLVPSYVNQLERMLDNGGSNVTTTAEYANEKLQGSR